MAYSPNIIQQFVVRFIDTVTIHRWTSLNHYAFLLSPLMCVGSIYGLKKLIQKNFSSLGLSFYIIIFTLLQNIIYHGPINAVFKPEFYTTQPRERDANELIQQIPLQTTVASQNSLLPHLSERSKFYLLPDTGDSEYIAIDLYNGPNKYSPSNYKEMQRIFYTTLNEKGYKVVWNKNDSWLFHKNR